MYLNISLSGPSSSQTTSDQKEIKMRWMVLPTIMAPDVGVESENGAKE
jgi:hypothetical protein